MPDPTRYQTRQVHKDGYVIGGACDTAHRARAERERGVMKAWQDVSDAGVVKLNHGQFTITGNPFARWAGKPAPTFRGGEFEVGYGRVDRALALLWDAGQQSFPEAQTKDWIEQLAAPEPCGLIHQGGLYKKRKAQGDFEVLKPERIER